MQANPKAPGREQLLEGSRTVLLDDREAPIMPLPSAEPAGSGLQADGTPITRIAKPSSSTVFPARILQVLRNSATPSTDTAPLATSALPAPPLSQTPASFNSWLSSTYSRSSS